VSPLIKSLISNLDIFNLYHDLGKENQPFFRILELVHRAGAKYCFQWEDTGNDEWGAEYSELYSKIHPPVPNHVLRLDFFEDIEQKQKYYGYVALRLKPIVTVIEAVICPPTMNGNHYLLCGSNYNIDCPDVNDQQKPHLLIDACPFVQQDGVIGICAHASIRALSLLLANKYPGLCQRLTVKDILDRVSKMPMLEGSHLPSTGLRAFEIFSAIESMGTSPILYSFVDGLESESGLTLEQIIYPYVESSIPILLIIETDEAAHSLLVVGHTFDRDSWWQRAELAYFGSITPSLHWLPSFIWSPEFIIQDDNFGPYMSSPRTLLGATTKHVLIPMPPNCPIFLPGYKAESLVAGYLTTDTLSFVYQRTQIAKPWKDVLADTLIRSRRIVLRPLLATRDSYIAHLRAAKISDTLIAQLEGLDLPPWLWVVEVSSPELYSRLLKIGEVLLNPTYPVQHIISGDEPLLITRLFDTTVKGTDFQNPIITGDADPIEIISRPSF
jgi:hypothetical protein